MADFRRASQEQVNVFGVNEMCLFKHYFESDEVFDRLKRYYNNQQYRFEVPLGEFEDLRSFLANHDYGLVVVDVVEPFVVVVKKYTAHPDDIFRQCVIQRTVDGYNCFLLTDQAAVKEAVQNGATRLTETDIENPF